MKASAPLDPDALPPDAATYAMELGSLLAADEEDPLTGEKVRFGTQLPPQTLLFLHRLAYWSRDSITDIVDAALLHYLHTFPAAHKQARNPLTENERIKRKQPRR